MKGIKINKSSKTIMCVMMIVVWVAVLPLLIIDFIFYGMIEFSAHTIVKQNRLMATDHCVYENENTTRELDAWLEGDQKILFLSLVYVTTLALAGYTSPSRYSKSLLLALGYGMFAICTFQFIWTIEGIVIFSHIFSIAPTLLHCDSRYQPFMYVVCSLGVIMIIAKAVVSWLRPTEEHFLGQTLQTQFRGIRLNNKTPLFTIAIICAITLITNIPFLIAHMSIVSGTSECLLDQWLLTDYQLKVGIVVSAITFVFVTYTSEQSKQSKMVALGGYILFALYLFQLFLMIDGIVLFDEAINKQAEASDNSYSAGCKSQHQLKQYLISLSILGMICTITNIIICWFRPHIIQDEFKEQDKQSGGEVKSQTNPHTSQGMQMHDI